MTYIIYDKTYEGPRYTYGLQFRPVMLGAQPKGYIADSERPHKDYHYGTVQYPRELYDWELVDFEMERLPRAEDLP